jgi:hypothetical protein
VGAQIWVERSKDRTTPRCTFECELLLNIYIVFIRRLHVCLVGCAFSIFACGFGQKGILGNPRGGPRAGHQHHRRMMLGGEPEGKILSAARISVDVLLLGRHACPARRPMILPASYLLEPNSLPVYVWLHRHSSSLVAYCYVMTLQGRSLPGTCPNQGTFFATIMAHLLCAPLLAHLPPYHLC